jgi:hypothetical protein
MSRCSKSARRCTPKPADADRTEAVQRRIERDRRCPLQGLPASNDGLAVYSAYTLLYTVACVTLVPRGACMPTNLALDDQLIEAAVKAGRHRTKKEAVTAALEEYVRYRKQLDVIELMGVVDYDPDYDAKEERRRR